ncbi:transglutaminase domain-containing protein [Vallitalea okinawensis]|uniref:transglutaminase domain-containing protein n=1 Tax=Vallitalea okinawensis TaxID=2078660 RepID=UPI000CFE07C8|nr:transglutaminase domain-containing protein [Vallitalea okinawensis]
MLFSEELKASIDTQFEEAIQLAGYKKNEILEGLRSCSQLEKSGVKFLYGSMPLSDMVNVDFDIYLQFVKHALFIRENTPWGKSIPSDIFLNYVMLYRVNNENIEDCRSTFYKMLCDRIVSKSMVETVIEVNYWCLEQATYQATDIRTASPLTLLKSAYGRCGELSTFTVTALRSIGIPARQVYVPRWSHCDDNHAWVEVWCDGNWYYLGGCEPEPVLNRGWFTAAASRAMLIHSRVFSSCTMNEEVISKNDKITYINHLSHYAESKEITVLVVDSNQQPVEDVMVRFEVLNYSEFFPVTTVRTGHDGKAHVTLGLGHIHIHVMKDNQFINQIIDTREQSKIILHWDEAIKEKPYTEDFEMIPPEEHIINGFKLTSQQEEESRKRFNHSDAIRKEKESSFHKEYKSLSISDEQANLIEAFLLKSKGNAQEIIDFLNRDAYNLHDKLLLLGSLIDKDYTDVTAELLEEHLKHSLGYKGLYPEEIFIKNVMNPRVYYEMITNYRPFILDYFDSSTQHHFENHPKEIWNYISRHISKFTEKEYSNLYTGPVQLLQLKMGSIMSQKILFIAICRTLGIAARINEQDLSLQYYQNGDFITIQEDNDDYNAQLSLQTTDDIQWSYMQNWSIAVLREGVYQTLDLIDEAWENNQLTLHLVPGHYRIITTNRVPNGTIYARKYSLVLQPNDNKELGIEQQQIKITNMLENIEIKDFKLFDHTHHVVMADSILKDSKNILLWVDEGKEPTEHILNEMIDLKDKLNEISSDIIMILRNEDALQNETLSKAIEAIPKIRVYYDDFTDNVSSIARKIYVDPDKLPLIIVTHQGLNVIYGSSGYNVGVTDCITKIIESVKE